MPKINLAIGMPDARVFLEPQKTVAISSSVLKFIFLAIQVVSTKTTYKSADTPIKTAAIIPKPLSLQSPELTESLKAEKINIKITILSVLFVMAL